jgi:hypothetical protein
MQPSPLLVGQSRRFEPLQAASGLPRSTDIVSRPRLVWFVPIAALTGSSSCLCYFVTTFTPLRFFASMALCTTPVCFASSTIDASRACAAGERPFGSAAATRTVPKAPGTILAPVSASAAGYPTPESAPKTLALPERRRSAASAAIVSEEYGRSQQP